MDIEFVEEFFPKPTEEMVCETEVEEWRLRLPADYREFLLKYNGGEPVVNCFYCQNQWYRVDIFLGLFDITLENDNADYDIDVIRTQLGERIDPYEPLWGCLLLPIAELYGEDYLCLDFRETPNTPSVCVWHNAESEDLAPVTDKVADSFTEFLTMLEKEDED